MGALTLSHLDELNRMFREMATHRQEHPELYCDHWELNMDLFDLLRRQAEPPPDSRPSLGLGGIRLEINRFLPKNRIVCVDVKNGERKIVKIIDVELPA